MKTAINVLLFAAGFVAWVNFAAHSDARLAAVQAQEEAEEQAALASRQWAARQICGENGTGVWKGDASVKQKLEFFATRKKRI